MKNKELLLNLIKNDWLYQKYGNDDGIIKLWSNHFEDIIELWEKYNSLWEEYNSLDNE